MPSDRHKACADRPRWRRLHHADDRVRVRHLDISESEPGAACDRAVLIGYGVANLVALLFPLDLSSNASVPMHIVATNMLLVLMLAAMGFGAAAFHGWLRLSSIASLVTESQALYRSWPRLMRRRQCWASASESSSARSCCGLQFLPLRCGVRRWTRPANSTMKRPRFGAASF